MIKIGVYTRRMSLAGTMSGGTTKEPQVARTRREEGRYTWNRDGGDDGVGRIGFGDMIDN